MTHDPYSLTELIRNDAFISWVMRPDAESDARWQNFLLENPAKKKTVEAAREYVILLAKDTGRDQPTKKQSERMWSIVENAMHESPAVPLIKEVPVRRTSAWRWARAAASVALVVGIGVASYWFFYKNERNRQAAQANESGAGKLTETVEKRNDSNKPVTILLPDGSSVVLQPGGMLSYSAGKGNRREVQLTGKAFFEIVRDENKPFLVISSGLATKVLGTSFVIDASEGRKDIQVEVVTGIVSVFSIQNKDLEGEYSEPALKGITLKKSQKIAYSRENGTITKLPDEPVSRSAEADISKMAFVFDETPVAEVFNTLAQAYQMEIDYDKEKLGSCPLNATLIGQLVREKLDVICNALNAHYEIAGNRVTISGGGCK